MIQDLKDEDDTLGHLPLKSQLSLQKMSSAVFALDLRNSDVNNLKEQNMGTVCAQENEYGINGGRSMQQEQIAEVMGCRKQSY